jgi:hypothetical protein
MEGIVIAMRKYAIVLLIGLGVVGLLGYAAPPAPVAIGFGVGAPPFIPIEWSESFSFLTTELFLDPNLTLLFTLGTYPADFPTLYEGSGSLIVKAWLGPVALYAGGGFTIQSRLITDTWFWVPFMNITAGMQLWVTDSFALITQVRSIEPLPPRGCISGSLWVWVLSHFWPTTHEADIRHLSDIFTSTVICAILDVEVSIDEY